MQPAATPEFSPLVVHAPVSAEYAKILTPEALEFVGGLAHHFTPRLQELLAARAVRQKEIDEGKLPDFLPETKTIREGRWRVGAIPADLQDRRVEITGPVERKMIINALNSGAKVFMADFEDANTPSWDNNLQGQINLRDAIARTIAFTSPEGKSYKLNDSKLATLIVRPRGWHLLERHVTQDGQPIPAAMFDFGLYIFHNAKSLLEKGTGPYFYLPKLESHKEAALWRLIFAYAEDALALKKGTIKATILIETILAAFEMEEILYELRDYAVGLNCGRWDYIFSFIKKFHKLPAFVMPDRAQVTMTSHFLRSYSQLLIKSCHKRGAFAMGGMAAQIPIKNDAAANEQAIARVKADKEREAGDGHDGTWVAHPGLIPTAMEVFDRIMPKPNQLDKLREDVSVVAKDLLEVPQGNITANGFRNNISVSLLYLESWLNGNGCVPIYNLMEDAATAEIARTQLWQWITHKCRLEDGTAITGDLYHMLKNDEMKKIEESLGEEKFANSKFRQAEILLDSIVLSPQFTNFVTIPAYAMID